MKKSLALVLCLVVAISLLAACGKTPDDTPATDADGRPIVTIGLPENPSVIYENNTYTQLIEELSGCKIEFEFFQSNKEDYLTQLSTRTAANEELPDILWGFNGMDEDTRNKYGQDETFINILPLLMDREKSAIFWERFEQLEHTVQTTVLTDMLDQETGEAYAIPSVLDPEEDVCGFMPLINQKWLERLNLEMPKTVEALEHVLREFRDKDPNGNGQKDEIPCLVQKGGTGARGLDYLINLFTYLDTQSGWFQVDDNGKLICTATSDEYRNALKWVHKMVQEGLIHENSVTAGSSDINYFFVIEGLDRLGMTVTHPSIGWAGGTDATRNWVPLECVKYTPIFQGAHLYCTFITSSCKNVDAAWKVIMAMFTREAQVHMTLGQYGVNYTDADPNTLGVWGGDAIYKVIGNGDTLPTKNRWLLHGCGIMQNVGKQMPSLTVDEMTPGQYRSYVILPAMIEMYTTNAEKNNPDPKNICPKLVFNAQDRLDAPGFAILPDKFVEWRALFMAGTKNPNNENDWNEYLNALESSGLSDYIETAQVIYDREFKNKT